MKNKDKKNLLYEEIYIKTQNCGRTQFVKLLQKNQIKIEQLQQENIDLKQMVNFPSVTITTCPKCGKKYSINYCKEVYELEKENKELKEQIKLFKKDLAKAESICQKYISQYYDIKLILNQFEKWLEEDFKKETEQPTPQIYCNCYSCKIKVLDKLKELKEGKK